MVESGGRWKPWSNSAAMSSFLFFLWRHDGHHSHFNRQWRTEWLSPFFSYWKRNTLWYVFFLSLCHTGGLWQNLFCHMSFVYWSSPELNLHDNRCTKSCYNENGHTSLEYRPACNMNALRSQPEGYLVPQPGYLSLVRNPSQTSSRLPHFVLTTAV